MVEDILSFGVSVVLEKFSIGVVRMFPDVVVGFDGFAIFGWPGCQQHSWVTCFTSIFRFSCFFQ